MILALDTETTGLSLYHGCMPFMLTAASDDGSLYCWEWAVDPSTREVLVPKKETKEIFDLIYEADSVVFHNSTFDLQAISLVIPKLKKFSDWTSLGIEVNDTMLSAHVLCSADRLGLKEQASENLGIPSDDEDELEKAAKAARRHRIVTDLIVRTAKKGDPLLPGLSQKFHCCDYWLPKWVRWYWESLNDFGRKKYKEPPVEWLDVCKKYALKDVERTICLFKLHQSLLESEGLEEVYERERALVPVIWSLQSNGVHVHKRRLHHEIDRLSKNVVTHQQAARKTAKKPDLNLNSGPQLQTVIYDILKYPVTNRTDKGSPSTDSKTLAALNELRPSKFLTELLDYSKANTAVDYLRSYLVFAKREGNGVGLRIFPGYRQTGTHTTRLSSSFPNLQNVSKGKELLDEEGNRYLDYQLRKVYGPAPGRVWFPIDYQQLQLRIFAWLSEEESLIQAFKDGWDFHNYVACRIFDTDSPDALQRRIAKNVNFGRIFGAGDAKIDATAGRPGTARQFDNLFPNVESFMQATMKQSRKTGYVTTPRGYRLYIPKDRPYACVNYLIQGTEGEIVKEAMRVAYEMIEEESFPGADNPFITLQVHDELVFDFPYAGTDSPPEKHWRGALLQLKSIMEYAGSLSGIETPVDISVVKKCWSNPKKVEVSCEKT